MMISLTNLATIHEHKMSCNKSKTNVFILLKSPLKPNTVAKSLCACCALQCVSAERPT